MPLEFLRPVLPHAATQSSPSLWEQLYPFRTFLDTIFTRRWPGRGETMGCMVAVPQDQSYVVENCGKYGRILGPGFNCVGFPPFCAVGGRLTTRIVQMTVPVETKTLDNVFVKFVITIQYRVNRDKIYEAFYCLADPVSQIQSYVYDVIRASVPKLTLDETFAAKDDIATSVRQDLTEEMKEYGFDIVDTLVTEITPDGRVKDAMNEIEANKRFRLAAVEKGEEEKIRLVKEAEAEAEGKYLAGKGLANQRKAIINGLSQSVVDFASEASLDAPAVMDLVLLTQYFDTMKSISSPKTTKCVFYQEEEGAAGQLSEGVRTGVLQGSVNID